MLPSDAFAAGAAEVHMVMVRQGDTEATRPGAAWGLPDIGNVEVRVSDLGRPVVLVLGSCQPTHWSIEIDAGARLAKVIAQGTAVQFVSGVPPAVPVVRYFSHAPAGIRGTCFNGSTLGLIGALHDIRRLTGKTPTTAQGGSYSRYVIDGKATARLPTTLVDQSAVELFPAMGTSGSAFIASYDDRPNRQTSPPGSARVEDHYATAKATRAYVAGRHYVEATFRSLRPGFAASPLTNVGVMSVGASRDAGLLGARSHLAGHGYPLLSPEVAARLVDGDIVGVAIDLASGEAQASLNGRWLAAAGTPRAERVGGIKLPLGPEYLFAVTLGYQSVVRPAKTGPHTWEVNFGATPFRYSPPAGFAAYAEGRDGVSAFATPGAWEAERRLITSGAPRDEHWGGLSRSSHRVGGAEGGPEWGTGPTVVSAPQIGPSFPVAAGEKLHAIGIYEAEDARNRTGGRGVGEVSVRVTQPGTTLLLMAYEPVRWRIELAPGAKLTRAVAMGYHRQEILGAPAGAEIVAVSHEQPRGSLTPLLFYGQREKENAYQARAAQLFGRVPDSTQASYRGSAFAVGGAALAQAQPPRAPGETGVIRCGNTTIVCDKDDTIVCGGRKLTCPVGDKRTSERTPQSVPLIRRDTTSPAGPRPVPAN